MSTAYPRPVLYPKVLALAIGCLALAGSGVRAALPLQPEQIVVTCFSGTVNYYSSPPTSIPNQNTNGYVVAQFDTTTGTIGPLIPPTSSPVELWDAGDTPPWSGFHNETGQPWNSQRLGEVFGICVDDASPPNIYVTATEAYNIVGSPTPHPKGPGGFGGVYRLDGTTGASSFGSLPNSSNSIAFGPGLGNVCYRRAANNTGYLYISNLEDGKIYRMNATNLTQVGAPFDHGVTARTNASLPQIVDDGTPGLTQFGRRIWGVQTYQGRLYYAVWWEDSRNISLTESNEIWSVALDSAGDFVPATAQRLFALPNYGTYAWSHPAASIDFSQNGKMFLAERYWQYLGMIMGPTFGAHHTRILRYWLSGTNWVTDFSPTHQIGGNPTPYFPVVVPGANSAGGVAVNCDESVWGTGDMYAGSYSTPPNIPFGAGDLGYVYGCLRIPSGGNSMLAGYGYGGFAIDYDGNTNSIAKFGVGAIATVKDCCVPPPTGMAAWWPLDELNGATTYADLSGNGNTAFIESGPSLGSFPSPAATAGVVLGGSQFLDSLSRGRAPNAPSLNFGTNSFSLDCWVRPVDQSPANSWQTIVDKLDVPSLRGYTIGLTNGLLAIQLGDGAIATHIGPAVSNFNWNFVGVVVNRAANTVRFYVNGVPGAPQPLTITGSLTSTNDLRIGAPWRTNVISETALDEIELFNRAITSNELYSIWVAGPLGKCKTGQPPCTNGVISIICPTNMTIACAPIVYYPAPQAFTTCGMITNVTCVPPSGSNFPVGTNTVTCTAWDSLGNSNSCSFTINVLPDVTPPVIDCACLTNSFEEQLNVIGCTGVVPGLCLYSQCAYDDCGLANCSQTPPAGTQVGPGVTLITLTVWDYAGNSNSCVVQMTVTPPPGGCPTDCQITCPTNVIVTACGPDAVVFYPPPVLSSNCPPDVTVLCNPPSGSTFPLGTNQVTCVVVDGLGGVVASCDFLVIVLQPPQPPWTIVCPEITASINVTGCPPVMPNLSNLVTIVTNCNLACPITVTQDIPPGTPLTAGTYPVILTVCDCQTNCLFCDVIVNAHATGGNPVITCPPNQVITTCGTNAVAYYKVKATNYTGVLTCTPPSGSVFPLGTTWVTCTATNACGGIATCTFSVTVKKLKPWWLCNWQVGIGIPYEPIGGATTALKAVGPGGPGYPAVCVFPNVAATNSGVKLFLDHAEAVRFTTALDFTAPAGAGIDLVLPPSSMNTNNTPILSFRSRGASGYGVRMNKPLVDNPAGLFHAIAVNTNGNLLDSVTFNSAEAATNDLVVIGFQPGVTECHVIVQVDCVTGGTYIEFEGPVVPFALGRKGWDGCIYGPDRPVKKPVKNARIYVTPPVAPGQPPITELRVIANGLAEVGIEEPVLTAKGKCRKWGDGHVTLMKLYDDEGSLEFVATGPDSAVSVDLGHAESFDLRLVKFETDAIPGEELLTRTIGPIRGLTNRPPPPFLDALLLKENSGGVEVSADFGNIDSPTVHVLIYSNDVVVADRPGVPAQLGQVLFTLSAWPDQLGKLGGTTPCRRGKGPMGLITLPDVAGTGVPEEVTGDEFRVLAELAPGAPLPDAYTGLEFLPSEDGDWGVEQLVTVPICVPQPVAIARHPGTVTVTWSGEDFRLQGAEKVAGPWFDLGVGSPVQVPASSSARYFRLLCD